MTVHQTKNQPFFCLVLATFSVFLGRGLQHFVSETPYRAFFWDEKLFGQSGLIGLDYATTVFTDGFIESLGFVIGGFLIILSMLSAFVFVLKKNANVFNYKMYYILIAGGVFILFALSILYSKDRFFEIPQFLEYTAQWISPILLILYLKNGWTKKLLLLSKIALSLTFACHGIYALDLLPVPVHFMEMTMSIMHINEEAAKLFLKMAGIMDFIVAILIFFPNKLKESGLIYMIIWGALTALARLVYQIEMSPNFISILIGFSESLMRFPHFIIPILLLSNTYKKI